MDLNRNDLDEKLAFICSKSIVESLDYETAVSAGRIRSSIGIRGMGIVGCILLAAARRHGVKVLTGDKHFKSIREADYFGA